jgi:hypothetical protein
VARDSLGVFVLVAKLSIKSLQVKSTIQAPLALWPGNNLGRASRAHSRASLRFPEAWHLACLGCLNCSDAFDAADRDDIGVNHVRHPVRADPQAVVFATVERVRRIGVIGQPGDRRTDRLHPGLVLGVTTG